ncbi:hypothetical protein V5E97_06720 [Singulisphaera sp. Ch08]|uniref:Uncharacterized protein n=1 Tax=Singulisphaera sp. Ch08 TaxID=3120278 RepID=A0AAU7CKM6_9BACT
MAAPTALAETHIPCIESLFTLGADPNTAELKVINGSYTLSWGVDEMTNNKSGAAYEDVKTYQTMTGNFTAVFEKGNPPVFKSGDIFPIVIDNANENGPYLACNARFNEVATPILDVKAGLKYSFTVRNQGAITTTRPGP